MDPATIELVVSLGGDGSILSCLHNYPQITAPILGINLGSLGFLADIPVSGLFPALEQVVAGNYSVQHRLMIEGKTASGDSCFAVNEIVLHRGKNYSLVDLAIEVDGTYFNTFSADGIIIATPSGSTAYSLSAGGPILAPDLDALVITPICPHTISNRPIVIKPKQEIRIKYLNNYQPVEIVYDGICRFSLSYQQQFCISPAVRRFPLVKLPHLDYFATLRSKLGWTGTLKEK